MSPIRHLLAVVIVVAGSACADDVLAPTPDALTGRWSAVPEALSPSGQLFRTLDFTADRRYVRTYIMRGVYPQLPADSAAVISHEYGSYTLHGDTLFTARDSARTRDWLGGEYLEVGPPGMAIEGPPTPPVLEITPTRLTLRFMFNPGDGYHPAVEVYLRER